MAYSLKNSFEPRETKGEETNKQKDGESISGKLTYIVLMQIF